MDTTNMPDEITSVKNILQYFTFYMGQESYGVEVAYVKEVIGYHRVYPVPLVPEYIRGVINLRGDVLPVIDMSFLFFGNRREITPGTSIMIIELHSKNEVFITGAIIDRVDAVVDIPEENIESAPEFSGKIPLDYINGVGKPDERFIILLNMEKVLDIDVLSKFSAGETV